MQENLNEEVMQAETEETVETAEETLWMLTRMESVIIRETAEETSWMLIMTESVVPSSAVQVNCRSPSESSSVSSLSSRL